MSFSLRSIAELGVSPHQPSYLQQRLRLTNRFAVILILLVLPYMGITYVLFPSLLPLPILGILVIVSVPLLNYWGIHWLSRLLISLLFPLLVGIFHAFLISANDSPLPAFYLIQLAILSIPWLVFDFREKAFLMLSSAIGILGILLLPVLNEWCELPLDNSFFQQGIGAFFSTSMATLVLILLLYLIQQCNYSAEQKNEALRLEMQQQNREMQLANEERNTYIRQVEQAQEEERKRAWTSEGLATFSQLLRNNLDSFSSLTDQVMGPLVRYIQANQGGIFILNQANPQEPYLELVACYAYERKKHLHKKVDLGEGLLGQAYLEKDIVYLTDVPSNYVHITSGLGHATPRCLLIVPLKANTEVVGMIELAFFHTLEAYQIEFIEKVGENLASLIANIRTNEITRQLLEESQMQTEMMRAQEEEMRQNMEELQATQEEMGRKERDHLKEIERLKQLHTSNTTEMVKKEVEMKGIFSAINTTLATIEFDMEGHILDANENFLQLMHTTLSEIQGCHHRQFIDPVYANSDAYQAFWQALKEGISQTDDFKRLRKDGSAVWMRASYTPVRDQKGKVFKVIKLAQDITEKKRAEIEFQTLSMVADNTDNSVIITNTEGFIEYINPGFTRMTGYTLQDCVGKKPGAILQGADTDTQTIQRIREKIKTREACYEEILNYDKAGNSYWISLAINPVLDEEGRVHKFISIQANVTDTKRIALDFTSQLQAISRASAIVEFDLQGNIQTANDNFLQLMEYTLEEVLGQHHRMFVLPDEQESEQYRSFWERLRHGEFESGEFTRLTKSGKQIWLRGNYNAIMDINGMPYKVVKYALDITLQKHLEWESQQQAQQMQMQAEVMRQSLEELEATREQVERQSRQLEAQVVAINSTLATIEFSLEGTILTVNDNFLQLMGYEGQELLNHSHQMLVDPAYAQSSEYAQFWQELRAGKAQIGKVKRLTKEGREVWLNASYTPVFDRQNRPVKIIKLAQHIH